MRFALGVRGGGLQPNDGRPQINGGGRNQTAGGQYRPVPPPATCLFIA
ncbi:hypothetical protein HMPREF0868_0384 [Mageeibacillus indolicus UPII9-5]|uniref:Uncharacterized protein n=1 Tax=Mageeibacillus indolicus (strain UPII9-5) TaxID=699246 RepID=D3R0L5_MAGIU|nr:hypothetical protein HMPREF0868_0384 [Mageeibacillus indolicus UPII9-5]